MKPTDEDLARDAGKDIHFALQWLGRTASADELSHSVVAWIRRAAAAERERDKYKRWYDEVDDALVCCHMVASEDPRESLNRLICWNNKVALDPAVSDEAAALRDSYKSERDELRAEVERLKRRDLQWQAFVNAKGWEEQSE